MGAFFYILFVCTAFLHTRFLYAKRNKSKVLFKYYFTCIYDIVCGRLIFTRIWSHIDNYLCSVCNSKKEEKCIYSCNTCDTFFDCIYVFICKFIYGTCRCNNRKSDCCIWKKFGVLCVVRIEYFCFGYYKYRNCGKI